MFSEHLGDYIISGIESGYKAFWQMHKNYRNQSYPILIVVDSKLKFIGVITASNLDKLFETDIEYTAADICNRDCKYIQVDDISEAFLESRYIFDAHDNIKHIPVVDKELNVLDIMNRERAFSNRHKLVVIERCSVCGRISKFEVPQGATYLPGAKCMFCYTPLRTSDVAKAIIDSYEGKDCLKLADARNLSNLKILNTCSQGAIHSSLKSLQFYKASELFDDIPVGAKKENIYCVDLCNIPFEDNTLDLIITETVFEHIPDYGKAFSEIHRVLKKGGKHIFSIPLSEQKQKTVSRIGNLKKVFHEDPLNIEGTLVCTEFGKDIIDIIDSYGFTSKLIMSHKFYEEKDITDYDTQYEEYLRSKNNMFFLKYNSVVIVSSKN